MTIRQSKYAIGIDTLHRPRARRLHVAQHGVVRDIEVHLKGLYGVEIGRDTISRVTEAGQEEAVTQAVS